MECAARLIYLKPIARISDIVDADFFKAIVQRYQMEARIGCKMIDQFQHLNRFVDDRGLIKLSVS